MLNGVRMAATHDDGTWSTVLTAQLSKFVNKTYHPTRNKNHTVSVTVPGTSTKKNKTKSVTFKISKPVDKQHEGKLAFRITHNSDKLKVDVTVTNIPELFSELMKLGIKVIKTYETMGKPDQTKDVDKAVSDMQTAMMSTIEKHDDTESMWTWSNNGKKSAKDEEIQSVKDKFTRLLSAGKDATESEYVFKDITTADPSNNDLPTYVVMLTNRHGEDPAELVFVRIKINGKFTYVYDMKDTHKCASGVYNFLNCLQTELGIHVNGLLDVMKDSEPTNEDNYLIIGSRK